MDEARITIKYNAEAMCADERKEFEAELSALLEEYGWSFYASGLNIETNMRDIAYEKENK